MHDALNELRQALRSKAYMLRFKDRFLQGQGANTCVRNCLKNIDGKVLASASKYCAAYRALVVLGGLLNKVGWKNQLRHLADKDIRSMTDGTDDARSEGWRKLSWIWLVCGYSEGAVEDDDEGVQDGTYILKYDDLTLIT